MPLLSRSPQVMRNEKAQWYYRLKWLGKHPDRTLLKGTSHCLYAEYHQTRTHARQAGSEREIRGTVQVSSQ